MSGIDDLRRQLTEAGRAPAPEPRPEFAERLLAHLQSLDAEPLDGSGADVVDLASRRSAVRPLRAAALGAVAAAVLLVAGVIAFSGEAPVPTNAAMDARVIADQTTGGPFPVEVGDDGSLRVADTGEAAPDGVYDATCTTGGRIPTVSGSYRCSTDEVVGLVVVDGKVAEVRPAVRPEDRAAAELGRLEHETIGNVIRFSWAPWPGTGEHRYEVRRATATAGASLGPEAVVATLAGDAAPVWSEDLTPLADERVASVAYRVVVVGRGGEVLARSQELALVLSVQVG
jgi:hypothetical protein